MANSIPYRALAAMQQISRVLYGTADAPHIPSASAYLRCWEIESSSRRVKKQNPSFKPVSDLEKHAVSFIRNRCTDLRYKTDAAHMDFIRIIEENPDAAAEAAAHMDADGTSLKPNQIPYNMQCDLDRRCLEVAVHRFLESGITKDAFDVYFCYLEMFFGSYHKTKVMIEMLSEFESNASSLLMKHRDHFSHSVYVFLIGLAFYDSSSCYRTAFRDAYADTLGLPADTDADSPALAAKFLEFWGLSSLFHDIGYPFELAFEQIKSYFGDTIDYVPFVVFRMNGFTDLCVDRVLKELDNLREDCAAEQDAKKLKKAMKQLNGCRKRLGLVPHAPKIADEKGGTEQLAAALFAGIENTVAQAKDVLAKLSRISLGDSAAQSVSDLNQFLADALARTLHEDYRSADFAPYQSFCSKNSLPADSFESYCAYLCDVMQRKAEQPETFNGFIDHAYFSTVILLRTLIRELDAENLSQMHTHALTAILLHNSFYKFSVTNTNQYEAEAFNNGRHFTLEQNPLAYLLRLADELQCWDRVSYGRNSRGEVHPFECRLQFDGDHISACYLFDKHLYTEEQDGTLVLKEQYKGVKGTYRKLTAFSLRDQYPETVRQESCDFLAEIEAMISLNGDTSFGGNSPIRLSVSTGFEDNLRFRNSSFSVSNFIHMYQFAVLVHQMNHLDGISVDQLRGKLDEYTEEFDKLSLEYKINHISRVKKYAKILDNIGCFYSDRSMDCEPVDEFSEKLPEMGAIEHERWCWEHHLMGWRHVTKQQFDEMENRFKASGCKGSFRECVHLHCDLFPIAETEDAYLYEGYDKQAGLDHYDALNDTTEHGKGAQDKDTRTMNNLLRVLREVDGIRIYRLPVAVEIKENDAT